MTNGFQLTVHWHCVEEDSEAILRLSWKKAIIMYPGMAVIPGKTSKKKSFYHCITSYIYIYIYLTSPFNVYEMQGVLRTYWKWKSGEDSASKRNKIFLRC